MRRRAKLYGLIPSIVILGTLFLIIGVKPGQDPPDWFVGLSIAIFGGVVGVGSALFGHFMSRRRSQWRKIQELPSEPTVSSTESEEEPESQEKTNVIQ
jgi:hypothetical protein